MLKPEALNGPTATYKADVCKMSCMDKLCNAPKQAKTCKTICMTNTQDMASADVASRT